MARVEDEKKSKDTTAVIELDTFFQEEKYVREWFNGLLFNQKDGISYIFTLF